MVQPLAEATVARAATRSRVQLRAQRALLATAAPQTPSPWLVRRANRSTVATTVSAAQAMTSAKTLRLAQAPVQTAA